LRLNKASFVFDAGCVHVVASLTIDGGLGTGFGNQVTHGMESKHEHVPTAYFIRRIWNSRELSTQSVTGLSIETEYESSLKVSGMLMLKGGESETAFISLEKRYKVSILPHSSSSFSNLDQSKTLPVTRFNW